MKKALILSILLLVGIFYTGVGVEKSQAQTAFVTIGTGPTSGIYYPTGAIIAKTVNKKRKEHGVMCTVKPTNGSCFNVDAVLSGELELGMAQSDFQYNAVNGLGKWKNQGPMTDLRSVFSLYTETLDLIVALDANIKNFSDLKGKRVNIGNIGSGQRQNAIDALEANDINWEMDLHALSLSAEDAAMQIVGGKIDAAFYTVGHPSKYYMDATSVKHKVKFIPILNTDTLLAKFPYYTRAETLMKYYPGVANTEYSVPTFGVKATLVTSIKVPEEVIYTVTKEIFDNFDTFIKSRSTYAGLTKQDMLAGLSAPIHPGAMKYYQEAGLK